jgi:hypothetical protein
MGRNGRLLTRAIVESGKARFGACSEFSEELSLLTWSGEDVGRQSSTESLAHSSSQEVF